MKLDRTRGGYVLTLSDAEASSLFKALELASLALANDRLRDDASMLKSVLEAGRTMDPGAWIEP